LIDNDEFIKSQRLKPSDLKNKAYFGKNRNYFIQLVDDSDLTKMPNQFNPQYYLLKRLARKKSQPLFTYRVHLSDFLNKDWTVLG
jgi:hypothetical protein